MAAWQSMLIVALVIATANILHRASAAMFSLPETWQISVVNCARNPNDLSLQQNVVPIDSRTAK